MDTTDAHFNESWLQFLPPVAERTPILSINSLFIMYQFSLSWKTQARVPSSLLNLQDTSSMPRTSDV